MNAKEIEKYRSSFSPELLEKITEEYDNTDIKVADIIKKYGLPISQSQLSSFVLPKKHSKMCPYCNTNMLVKRTRNPESENRNDLYCPNCNHKIFTAFYKRCSCENCKEKFNSELMIKKQLILSTYPIIQSKTPFSQISFENQCLLFFLYLYNGFDDFETVYVNVHKTDKKYEPICLILQQLYYEEIINISLESPISAFSEDKFPNKIYLDKAYFIINVSFSKEDKAKFCCKTFPQQSIVDSEEKLSFAYKIMFRTLMRKIKKQLEIRKFDFDPTQKSIDNLKI